MSGISALFERLAQQARGLAGRARRHHFALVAAVVLIGAGAATLRAVALPAPRPVLESERLQIEVVAPVERELSTGPLMEVGELVEGFEYPPPASRLTQRAAYLPLDEDFEEPEPRRVANRSDDGIVNQTPPQSEAPADGGRDRPLRLWFGFDVPDRDYRAEREARRARLDARQQEDRDRQKAGRYSRDSDWDRQE